MKTAYVIFKEHPNTHNEVYVAAMGTGTGRLEVSETPEEALQFETARQGYNFAGFFPATLGNWRVGLR